MAKDSTPATTEQTVTAPDQQQVQLQIDDAQSPTYYSSTSRISASGEEITVDFSMGPKPTGQQNVARMKIDARVVLSPWAAKRLALALGQTIQRYEQAYGPLEIDPRKRIQPGAEGGSTTSAS